MNKKYFIVALLCMLMADAVSGQDTVRIAVHDTTVLYRTDTVVLFHTDTVVKRVVDSAMLRNM